MKKHLLFLLLLGSSSLFALTLKAPQEFQIEVGNVFDHDLNTEISALTPLIQKEGVTQTSEVKFRIVSGPTWLRIREGHLVGTPERGHTGETKVTYQVVQKITTETEGEKKKSKTTNEAIGTVNFKVFYTPKLATVELPSINERKAFKFVLKSLTDHPSLKSLSYSLIGKLPAWLTMDSNGILTGFPKRQDVESPFSFQVVVKSATGGETTSEVKGVVKKVLVPTKWKKRNFTLPEATEDLAYTTKISPEWIDNPENATLSFKVVEAEPWFNLSPLGDFSGTPVRKDVKTTTWKVLMQAQVDQTSFQDTASFTLKIKKINKPPLWKNLSITLPTGHSNQNYLYEEFKNLVSDLDEDKLKFQTVSGSGPPNWITFSPTGKLTAKLLPIHEGKYQWKVQVSDGKLQSECTVDWEVQNHSPAWLTSALTPLKDAMEDSPSHFDLNAVVEDPDKDPLQFTFNDLPKWLTHKQGVLTGTPKKKDVGLALFHVKISDGKAFVEKDFQIRTHLKPYAPSIKKENWNVEVKEKSTLDMVLNDPKYVTDENQDPLKFSITGPVPTWAKLTPDGQLHLQPKIADVGKKVLSIRISDGKLETTGLLNVTIPRAPLHPEWEEPLSLSTLSREAFSKDLNAFVKEQDRVPLKFKKTKGPEWVQLSEKGVLSAHPTDDQVGHYDIKVTASNDLLSASTEIEFKVTMKNHPPEWTQNKITLPEVRAANDYSQSFSQFAKDADKEQKLTFEKISGPSWALIDPGGMVFGKPGMQDKGETVIKVLVNDGAKGTAEASLHFKVIPPNLAPVVVQNRKPVSMIKVTEGELFLLNLNSYVTDPEKDTVQFKKISGPQWVSINPTGEVTGIASNPGEFQFEFEASDGNLSTVVKLNGMVEPK